MKHPYKWFLPSILLFICTIASQAQSDIYESYAILNINGSGNTYYDLNASTINPDFNGTNLGTFTAANSLILNGAQNKTYKCGTHNIMNAFIDYRIYEVGSSPGAFIPSEILFNSDDGTSNFCGNTSIDQTWESMGANINVLNGLTSGDYVLEVYVRSNVDTNSDNITDFTLYNSNSGSNFSTTFRVDNAPTAICQNITVQLDVTGNIAITPADINNGSTDDFDTPILSIDSNSFDCSDIGSPVTVTLTAEDSLGQTDTCTAIVTIEDNINPVTPTLAPVTVDCNGTLIPPTTTDNCAGTIIGTTSDTLSFVEGGSTTITWTFDDGNGNTITADQVYNYNDTTDPVAVCQNITAQLDATGNVTIVPADIDNGSSDNCGALTYSISQSSFTCADLGSNNVTLTINDGNGQTDSCVAVVTVVDNVNPIASCQDITVQLDASGNASILPADINNGSTDNCGISSISLSQTAFDCSNVGTNSVTLFVRDNSNNLSTCNATVTVTDPAASASVSIVVDENPVCADNIPTFTATPTDGGSNPIYEWFINGISFGNNSPSFTPVSPLNNGDDIFVRMQSSLSSCIIPKQSNTITMSVNALPVVSGPSELCEGSSGPLSPANWRWTSNDTSIATVNGGGLVTAVSAGVVIFTYTDADGCTSDISITINPAPNVTPPITICTGETYNISPNSGGTWSSGNNSIATVSNTGLVTGISGGTAILTFTDTNGCSSTTSVEVLVNPIISSLNATNTQICSGENSILSANVLGTASNDEVIINYNFNTGSSFATLDGQEAPGITSQMGHVNNYFRTRPGTATQGTAFQAETVAGRALRQVDNDRANDEGYWIFNIGGSNLSSYQDFKLYFQTRRTSVLGDDKYVYVFYRVNGVGGLVFIDRILLNNTVAGTQWQEVNLSIPNLANNPNQLEIMIGGDEGYDGLDPDHPDTLIDNVQVEASTTPSSFEFSWTSDTGAAGGLPTGADTPSGSNDVITVNPEVTSVYTLTVTNASTGCTSTDTVTVNVNPSPNITIAAEYCPVDDPMTPQDESNMVQLVATSATPVTSWTWLTSPTQTGNTIYVDTSGFYQVTATTADGCSESATIRVAQERIFNGDFSDTVSTSNGDFGPDPNDNVLAVGYDFDEDYAAPFDSGYRYFANPTLPENGMTVTNDPLPYNPTDFRTVSDHTGDTEAQFLVVNGGNTSQAFWRQEFSVDPNTEYYFSAWGIDLSNLTNSSLNACDLRFKINGVEVGPTLNLVKGNDWERFYGTWNSGTATNAIIELISKNHSAQGNNFGVDDISFATLSTFITLTSPTATTTQEVCQNEAITDITYDIGGGLNAPTITGLPAGLTTTFDGLEFVISGTPTVFGTFNYTITTTSTCDVKTATGTITINEEAQVEIQPITSPVCSADGTIAVSATLSGSATSGSWSTSGTGNFTGVSADGSTATYNFGINESGLVTLTFTSNVPSTTCAAASDDEIIEIISIVNADAGSNIDNSSLSCDNTTVTLAANNVTGQWTVTSGQDASSYVFSNANAYNSAFTGQSGETYTLQWEVTNTSPCANTTDTITVTFANCGNNLTFDGVDDHINFNNNYSFNSGGFTMEAWIKPNVVSGTQTIISKRNSNNLNTGYDLSLINNRLFFRWNSQSMFSTQTMNTSRWYHVAITYNGSTYSMYIDGFLIQTHNSSASPSINTNKSMIGGMDTANGTTANHFNGSIDEVRFWNMSLSENQVREMMNQEIRANGSNVQGEIIPIDIVGSLQWNNLIGYYQMNNGASTSISNGIIQDISTASPVQGVLSKMTSLQTETAPLPYRTSGNGAWDNASTWQNGGVQQLPNSTVNSINGLAQTWNIVVSQHNVSSNRATEVASLVVDANKLSIINDQSLTIGKYLKIDGNLDLVGQSQLLQPTGSIVDNSSTGHLERDQQGTSNLYNYNYFASPVSVNGSNYTLEAVLHDGTNASNPQDLNWTNAYDANPLTNPITLSRSWLYLYENYPENSFADWNAINENSTIPLGLGFSMKGSGAASADQNYTFIGKPNNGTITSPVSGGYQALVGNPYPSAIDANAFILDNSSVLSDGTLYFWEHAPNNNTHNTSQYQGGYAARNLTSGIPAVSPPEIDGSGNANKIPGRYVPVAQGFFVTGNTTGGHITFRNSQRVFVKEQGANSVFLRGTNNASATENQQGLDNDKFIRLNFITPEHAIRHLVVGFMDSPYATNGIDYGYDGLNQDNFPNDMSFNIEGEKFVIQGVGTYNEDIVFPLDIDLDNGGHIEIALEALENFDETIDVYIFDALDGSYTRINDINYQKHLETGNYSNRFSMVFRENNALSTVKDELDLVRINYLQSTNEIYVNLPVAIQVNHMELINILGQTVKTWNDSDLPTTSTFKLPISKISEGGYVLKVNTDKGTLSKKLIVNY